MTANDCIITVFLLLIQRYLFYKMNITFISYNFLVVHLYLQLSLFCFVISSINGRSPCFAKYQNGTLGKETNGTVSVRKEDIYAFDYKESLSNKQAIIINVVANASQDFPLLVVIQQQKSVSSWTVPFSPERKSTYKATSHVLCPDDYSNQTFFWVSLSSSSPLPVYYTLDPRLTDRFMLKLGEDRDVEASPSEPIINSFEFPEDVDTVLVKADSSTSICSILSVQGTKCPVFDLERNVEFSGNFQTMTHKSGIVVQKGDFPAHKFYIVIVVLTDDERCISGKNNKNPFRNDDIFRGSNSEGYNSLQKEKKNKRTKSLNLTVVKIPSEDEYTTAIIIPIFVFLGFYLIAAVTIYIQHRYSVKGFSVQSEAIIGDEDQGLVQEDNQVTSSNYGSTGTDPPGTSSGPGTSPEEIDDDTQALQQNTDEDLNDRIDGEFDFLDDIEEDKEIYRLKKDLFLSDLSKKKRKRLKKKYSLYHWNLIIIAVFYALPVVQLVFTYQRVLNASGDQDICYYNFYCSRPLGPLTSFNNVYSNIGYVMLGLLFFLLVWRRDLLHQRECVSDNEHVGIPQHYGIFYALALSLIMEGILSACYHVCPSYTNFQFDTSFMYIIACLIMVQLYSTRHPDLAAKPQVVFGIFAAIILLSVTGVVFTSVAFWTIFCFVLMAFSVYSTTQMYYMGRIRFSLSEIKRSLIFVKHDIFSCPVYKDRMVLLILANAVNWGLAINGAVTEPKDFASYLLAILIVNGLIYLLFYVVMKMRYKEKMPLLSVLCSVLTLACWAGSLTFFLQGLTSWQKSPAYSRENNEDCILFNFYDDHDVWHFLSAVSIFLSFMILLTMNDDLTRTPRNKIRVF